MTSAGRSGRHVARSPCCHAISGAAAAAFASISCEASTPVTRASGHRALRSRVTLPAPAPRSQTSRGSATSIRFSRSTAGRKRWSANFRYCAGSQAIGLQHTPARPPAAGLASIQLTESTTCVTLARIWQTGTSTRAWPTCGASTASTRGRSACSRRGTSRAPSPSARCACSTSWRTARGPRPPSSAAISGWTRAISAASCAASRSAAFSSGRRRSTTGGRAISR